MEKEMTASNNEMIVMKPALTNLQERDDRHQTGRQGRSYCAVEQKPLHRRKKKKKKPTNMT